MLPTRKTIGVLSLLALVFALASCVAPRAASGSKVVYGLTLAPSGMDPHVDVSSELGIPLTSVYDTLVYRTAGGEFVPGLAESWGISADGAVYTFKLRKGVRFHDGTAFDALAVMRTLERVADPETHSRKAVLLLGPYSSTEVVDRYTVRIILTEAYAPLLDSLSQVYLGIASPAALAKWGSDYQLHQVGTGPYAMREYVPKDHMTLTRNPDYDWGPRIYAGQGPAAIDEIEFRFLVEPSVRLPALEAGDVDIVGEVPPADAPRVEANTALALQPVPIPGLPLVGFLNVAKPPTDDLRVRQALIMATDREALVRAVFGAYSPVAAGPLSHSHTYFDPSVDTMYQYDPEAAAELLDQAGWLLDQSTGLRQKDGEPLRLQAYVMTWGFVPEVSQWLQSQWRQVGIDLVINEVTFPAATEAVQQNQHHVIFWSEPGTDPDLLRSFFHSAYAGQRNWSNARSSELDALLEAGATESNAERRSEVYRQVQEQVMAEALILPIRDYVNLNASRSCVQDLKFDSRGWFPLLHDLAASGSCR